MLCRFLTVESAGGPVEGTGVEMKSILCLDLEEVSSIAKRPHEFTSSKIDGRSKFRERK